MKPRVFRRRLALEGYLVLAAAILAVRMVPAQRLTAWAARPPRRIQRFAETYWPDVIAAGTLANGTFSNARMPAAEQAEVQSSAALSSAALHDAATRPSSGLMLMELS